MITLLQVADTAAQAATESVAARLVDVGIARIGRFHHLHLHRAFCCHHSRTKTLYALYGAYS